ncbi:hypothetical protein DFH06DRAFT_1332085 [Mycena polygramma]|nr:hypothetical protein DFH06DRAFT_1332085 [Mycena polygramma]
MAHPISFAFPVRSPPASLAHLIESNVAPSSIESQLTRAYIGELESQIASLGGANGPSRRRRAELRQAVKSYKAVVSPIRRVPPEILGEIFSYLVPSHFSEISQIEQIVVDHAPWSITRVCSHWSAVALETPALWSTVLLKLKYLGEQGAVSLIELWLRRSRNMPLNVTIVCQGDPKRQSHAALDAAMSASNRWQEAYISIIPPLVYQLHSIRGRLSSLKTLDISVDLGEAHLAIDEDEAFWSILADAPQLTSLITHCWDLVGFLRPPFTVAWHRLTRLSTTFSSNTEALSTLRELSDIVECKFAFRITEVLPSDSTTTIHLPHLEFLALQVEVDDDTPPPMTRQQHFSLLDFLVTPSLRELNTVDAADEESVVGLVTRSGCATSLECLRFSSQLIDQAAILRLLRRVPGLTFLEIGDFDGTLVPQSSLPTFVTVLSDQWLKTQGKCLDSFLYVIITDEQHSGDIHVRFHDNRLSVVVSDTPSSKDDYGIISEPFSRD